jgi:two-component system, NtrC family, sensor kinase
MRLGIRSQLVLSLAGLCLLAFVPLYFAVASLTRATLLETNENHARAMGRVVAARMNEASASLQPTDLQTLLEAQIGNASGVGALGVYNQQGERVLQAGTPNLLLFLPAHVAVGQEQAHSLGTVSTRVLSVAVPGKNGVVVAIVPANEESGKVAPLVRLVAWYTGAVAVTLVVFAYMAMGRMIVQPVERLVRAAWRVTQGATQFEVYPSGAAELLELGRSLRAMNDRQRSDQQTLQERLEELQRTTEKLRSTQDQLIRSERLASVGKMAAGLAHEIGNPLAALMGLQDLMIEGGLSEEEAHDFLQRMHKETERIHRIVKDLLAFARPTIGKTSSAVAEPGQVSEAVDDVLSLIQPQKQMRDVCLQTSIPDNLPRVALAHEQLVQILLNLVLNAVDANQGQGTICMEARVQDDKVELAVQDDGPGISPEVKDSLFEPFVTTKDVGKGTGLGLATCKGLVESVGGTIYLQEQTALKGARFVLEIPTMPEDIPSRKC